MIVGMSLVVVVVVVVVVDHAFRRRLMGLGVLRGACRKQRSHNARRHGRARQAPKDQHHH